MISKNKNLFLLLFFKKNIYIIFSALKSAEFLKALNYSAKDMCRKNISPNFWSGCFQRMFKVFPKAERSLVVMIFRLSDRFLSGLFSLTTV